MSRGDLRKSWQPGREGGWFIAVDPSKTVAERAATRADNVHRTKWLCVDCLKTFKDVHADVDLAQRRCGSCTGLAVRVGVQFRPPKLTDAKGWKQAIEFLEATRWGGRSEFGKRARAALEARRARKRSPAR